MALEAGGLDLAGGAGERTAIDIGNALGGFLTIEKNFGISAEGRETRISPFFVPGMLPCMASGLTAICLGAKGPSLALNDACASGADAVGYGLRLIQNGEVDRVLAGGTEDSITPLMFHG